ncbi:MAG TPA: sigma 54-interacting transcriptional regulator [Edaphobacter sp.]
MSTPRPVLPFPAPLHYPEPKPSVDSQSFEMVGESEAMLRLRLQIRRVGPHFRMVLVRGEVGTGKELAARALHHASPAASGPFVVCHAASLEDASADGTADEWLRDLMVTAHAGTLYIDAIEEMPLGAQSRLLAALKRKTPQRIIGSTSEDLRGLAVSGRFRQELYHRIAMVEVVLSPLRERTDDIARLAKHYLQRFSALYGRGIHAIREDAMERMRAHSWPGNVRELENVIRNGVLQCDGPMLSACDLPTLRDLKPGPPSFIAPMSLQNVIDTHVQSVLRTCGGNKVKAAEMLGISRSTLYRMLESSSHPE